MTGFRFLTYLITIQFRKGMKFVFLGGEYQSFFYLKFSCLTIYSIKIASKQQ